MASVSGPWIWVATPKKIQTSSMVTLKSLFEFDPPGLGSTHCPGIWVDPSPFPQGAVGVGGAMHGPRLGAEEEGQHHGGASRAKGP